MKEVFISPIIEQSVIPFVLMFTYFVALGCAIDKFFGVRFLTDPYKFMLLDILFGVPVILLYGIAKKVGL